MAGKIQRVMRTYYGETQTHINEYLQKGWTVVHVNPIGNDALEYVLEKTENLGNSETVKNPEE